jgi:hypothetical protein
MHTFRKAGAAVLLMIPILAHAAAVDRIGHFADVESQWLMDYRASIICVYTLITFFIVRKSVPTVVELVLLYYALIALPPLPVSNPLDSGGNLESRVRLPRSPRNPQRLVLD